MRRVCAGTLVHYQQTVRLLRSGPARRSSAIASTRTWRTRGSPSTDCVLIVHRYTPAGINRLRVETWCETDSGSLLGSAWGRLAMCDFVEEDYFKSRGGCANLSSSGPYKGTVPHLAIWLSRGHELPRASTACDLSMDTGALLLVKGHQAAADGDTQGSQYRRSAPVGSPSSIMAMPILSSWCSAASARSRRHPAAASTPDRVTHPTMPFTPPFDPFDPSTPQAAANRITSDWSELSSTGTERTIFLPPIW